jgi:glycosyltransferase involved in cell wall biosynthesis
MIEKSITVVIPALNEEENILSSYETTKNILTKLNLDNEIILVEDGSKDKTLEIMEAINSKDSSIQIIHYSCPYFGISLPSNTRNRLPEITRGLDIRKGKTLNGRDFLGIRSSEFLINPELGTKR